MNTNILNRTSGPNIVKFLDICFKQGVIDACNIGNDFTCREFCDQHSSEWTFGVLGEPDDYDWRMFRFALYRWARQSRMTGFAENYIYRIATKSLNWCFILYCMRFYLMGIQEWLEYPNPVGIEIFKKTPRIHWKQLPKHLVKMTKPDIITYMQEIAFEYQRRPEEERPVSSTQMDSFCVAIFDLTRPLHYGKKIRG